MTSKLSMRIGQIRFKYEGDFVFDPASIKDLLSHMEIIADNLPLASSDATTADAHLDVDQEIPAGGDLHVLAPNSIAARLGVKTGTDLAIAAAAHLQLSLGRASFDRKELLSTMQSATNYYNAGMSGNLSKIIKSIVSSKRVNSLSNNQMSLSASEQSVLGGKLAE